MPRAGPGLAAALAGLVACTAGIPNPWTLTEEPRVLAMSVEVTDTGVHGEDLFPVPADRTRSEPLPGDEIEVTLLIASADGELDPATLNGAWFLCPAEDSCTGSLAGDTLPADCGDSLPLGLDGCVAGTEPTLRVKIPELLPEETLQDQRDFRVLYVAALDEGGSPHGCVNRVVEREPVIGECLLGLRSIRIGPLGPLLDIASEEGIEFAEGETPESIDDPLAFAPDFNPEIRNITLDGEGADPPGLVWPDEAARLEPDSWVNMRFPSSSANAQVYFDIVDGVAAPIAEFSSTQPFFTTDIEFTTAPGSSFFKSGTEDFTLFLVVRDTRGSHTWETFQFEVGTDK